MRAVRRKRDFGACRAWATCASLFPLPCPLRPQRPKAEGRKPGRHETRSAALDNVHEGEKKRSRLTRKTPPRPRDHPQCGCCYQHPEFQHEETEAQRRHVASPKIASKDNSLKGGHARRSTQVLESVPSSEQFFSAKATRVNKNGEKGPCRWALGKQCRLAETVLGCRGVQPGDPRLPRTLDCRRFPGTHRTPGLFTSTPAPFQES